MQHDLGSRRPKASGQDRDGFFSNDLRVNGHKSRCPHCQPGPQWVPCSWDGVKADHLAPSHLRAAASVLARSSGLSSESASSSKGSPLPAVFATRCHLRPSILSIGAPCPLTSTRARRVLGVGIVFFSALCDNATPAASIFCGSRSLLNAEGHFTFTSTLFATETGCYNRST